MSQTSYYVSYSTKYEYLKVNHSLSYRDDPFVCKSLWKSHSKITRRTDFCYFSFEKDSWLLCEIKIWFDGDITQHISLLKELKCWFHIYSLVLQLQRNVMVLNTAHWVVSPMNIHSVWKSVIAKDFDFEKNRLCMGLSIKEFTFWNQHITYPISYGTYRLDNI